MALIVDIGKASSAYKYDLGSISALIPAAGKGSRLGYHLPKLLFPILNKPIYCWLFEAMTSLVNSLVVVASPDGEELIKKALINSKPLIEVAIQEKPRGMADAIMCALPLIKTEHVLVVWGDQVTVNPQTLERCIKTHLEKRAVLTVPTILKADSYIHFSRDEQDRIVKVFQKREEPIPVKIGESDCGVFVFHTETLRKILREAKKSFDPGLETGEFNLLPLVPRFHEMGLVVTLRIKDINETYGVNDLDEVRLVSEILNKRAHAK